MYRVIKFKRSIKMRATSNGAAVKTLYLIALLDLLAVSLFLPLINREIQHMGGTPFMMGLVSSVYGGIQLISSPFFGRWSDVYGNKFTITASIALTVFAYILQGWAASLLVLMLARIIAGSFKHTQTLAKVALTNLAPNDKSLVLGNFNAFGSMGFIIGPTIGGHLVQYENGFRNVCFLSAFIFVVNIVLVLTFVPETSVSKTKPQDRTPILNNNSAAVSTVPRMSTFYVFMVLSLRFLFSFATLVPRSNLVLIMEAKYQTSVVSMGYLNSLQALVSTITGFCVGPVTSRIYREQHKKMVVHGSILQAISLVALFMSPTFQTAGISLMLLSATNPFLRVGITSLSLEHTSNHGSILGFGQTASSLARMLSPVTAGLVQEWGSYDGPALLASISAILGVLCVIFCVHPLTSQKEKSL